MQDRQAEALHALQVADNNDETPCHGMTLNGRGTRCYRHMTDKGMDAVPCIN